jgi:hypothetical protein
MNNRPGGGRSSEIDINMMMMMIIIIMKNKTKRKVTFKISGSHGGMTMTVFWDVKLCINSYIYCVSEVLTASSLTVLIIESVSASETSINFNETIRRSITEDFHLIFVSSKTSEGDLKPCTPFQNNVLMTVDKNG